MEANTMDQTKFREIEEKYKEIKQQMERGEIDTEEMKKRLKNKN